MKTLKDQVLVITGGTRGIGEAIAVRAGQDGAKVVILGKTDTPDPKLPGTIHTAVEAVEKAGGQAIAIQCDIRFEDQVKAALAKAFETFGRIDILVNNASAIWLATSDDTPVKRLDLMFDINARGAYVCSALALPYLRESENGHILTLSPPIRLQDRWFAASTAYTISKFAMSMVTKGLAAQEKQLRTGVHVNSLWPVTTIATAAVNMLGGEELMLRSRKPSIVADAAYWILTRSGQKWNGKFFLDEQVLALAGVTELDHYAVDLSKKLKMDMYVDRA